MRMQNVEKQAVLRRNPQFVVSGFRFLAIALAAVLGGCSSDLLSSSAPLPACPSVSGLKDANRITVYRPGPGRDITDIVYEARILGFDGDCNYTIKNKSKKPELQTYSSVKVNIRPRFRVTPGPAMTNFNVKLDYFTAIPAFYPHPEGRADFSRQVELPATRTQLDVTDADIEITIPLNERRSGPAQAVFVGFVLSEEQLKENRERPTGRLGL